MALVGESGNFASWLYIAAVKMNSLEKIESDLSELVEAMKTSPIFSQFTKDPSVPRETRLAAIVDVCDKAKFAEPTKNFLCMSIEFLNDFWLTMLFLVTDFFFFFFSKQLC